MPIYCSVLSEVWNRRATHSNIIMFQWSSVRAWTHHYKRWNIRDIQENSQPVTRKNKAHCHIVPEQAFIVRRICLKDWLLVCLKRSQALPSRQVYGLIHAFERTINRSYRLQVQTNGCHSIIVEGFFHLSLSSCSNWSNFSRTGCKKSFKSWLIFSLSWRVRSFSSLSLTSNYKVENEQVSS